MSEPAEPPSFIRADPPPSGWQDRVQDLDERLWIARNTLHPDGPRWCVVRYAPQSLLGVRAPFLVGIGEFGQALQGDWSFVRDLVDPDGKPRDLADAHILDLFHDDFWRKYARDMAEAKPKIDAVEGAVRLQAKAQHDRCMDEAFESANRDPHIVANRTSAVMSGAGA